MRSDSQKLVKLWTYAEAVKAVPYVRVILRELRENQINVWHLHRVSKKDQGKHHTELHDLKAKGVAALEELAKIGVLPYERATRGVALFGFVHLRDGKTSFPREAWFVYKDSRDTIDSYVFNDDLCFYGDLLGYEKPVPEAWKADNKENDAMKRHGLQVEEKNEPAPMVRTVADGIVNAFTETFDSLGAYYRDHPEHRRELVEKIAGLIKLVKG